MRKILMLIYCVMLPFQLHIAGYVVNIMIITMFALYIGSKNEYEYSKISGALRFFIVIWFISYLYSLTQTENILVITAEFKRLVTLVIGYYVFSNCIKTEDEHKFHFFAFLLCLTVVSLWTLKSGVLGGANFSDQKRASGPFGESWMGSDIAGAFLALFIPLLFAVMLAAKKNINKILGLFALIVGVLALFVTYSRGSIVAAVIGVIVIVVTHSWNKNRSISKLIFSLAIVTFCFMALLPESLKTRMDNTFVEGESGKSEKLDESSQLRIKKWEEGFNAFVENPLIGIGFKQFEEKFRHDPHNSFLQIASEMGILGIASFTYLFVVIIKEIMKNIQCYDSPILIGTLGCVVSFVIINNFYANFFRDTVIGSFWILLGLLDSYNRLVINKKNNEYEVS